MSNKPYSAFFKVGKDENLVEVRTNKGDGNFVRTINCFKIFQKNNIVFLVKNAKTIGRIFPKEKKCQDYGPSTRQSRQAPKNKKKNWTIEIGQAKILSSVSPFAQLWSPETQILEKKMTKKF